MTMWRGIPSLTEYEASDDGRIRKVRTGRILRSRVEANGYVKVKLWGDGGQSSRWVHRLVCEAFHGPAPQSKMDAAHCNGIRADNRSENVRWKTRAQNELDKRGHGTANVGERNGMAILTAEQVREIRSLAPTLHRSSGGKRIRKGVLREVAKKYGVTSGCLRQIISKSNWSQVR